MSHSKSPGYQPGNHWVECQVCGFDYRHSEMKKRWDNLIVCPKDFETRHPQDFVRARKDRITPEGLVNPPAVPVTNELPPSIYDNVPASTFCNDLEDPFYVVGGYWPEDYVDDSLANCDNNFLDSDVIEWTEGDPMEWGEGDPVEYE